MNANIISLDYRSNPLQRQSFRIHTLINKPNRISQIVQLDEEITKEVKILIIFNKTYLVQTEAR